MKPGAALVTGGAKRLGRAMALALAEDGWDVAISYLGSKPEAEATADEIRAFGRRAAVLSADLTVEAQTEALIPAATDALGAPLTCLVNNASIFEFDDLDSMNRKGWDRAIESNLRAPVLLTQQFGEQAPAPMTDAAGEPAAGAVVVNMIDQRVLKMTPKFMSYSIAKSALWAFTRMAAQGLAPRVRVMAIGPGPTLRGLRQSEAHFAAQRAATILGRGAGPDEIVAALRFILASPALTGQILAMDGGQHLGWRTPDVLGVE
ncbi:SDR family oxidoreductase [Pikeienuella piscinae]|uniref:SDR family oxidoreductase n=1 Tax=Pikeienuella piscinae TaxID=2748098 RepID=A0A7L5BZ99_9RHOB|nr:SDR family oxidoreductase [Pikeienuella piscinae]QIE55586.1 SDR family oxidoreductase [Pikeienuella piscinae]